MYDDVMKCAELIRSKASGDMPTTALILGSGLNQVADALTDAVRISYFDLPGFPKPTVEGHAGCLYIGRLDGKPLICLQGRAHAYEGHEEQTLAFMPRVMWALGVKTLIVTNAAGSLTKEAGPGSLMAISDHINFAGVNPLVGLNDDRFGVRFPDMSKAWNPDLRALMHACAKKQDITLHDGVYLMAKGPNFETPAEIHAFRTMGAGAVGMSTVPECLVANHCGMQVVGISSITNYAAGMVEGELTHAETMEFGAVAAVNLEKLLRSFVAELN